MRAKRASRLALFFSIGADFAQECQTSLDAHIFDGGQIHAELLAKRFAHRLLLGLVALFATHGWRSGSLIFESVHAGGEICRSQSAMRFWWKRQAPETTAGPDRRTGMRGRRGL